MSHRNLRAAVALCVLAAPFGALAQNTLDGGLVSSSTEKSAVKLHYADVPNLSTTSLPVISLDSLLTAPGTHIPPLIPSDHKPEVTLNDSDLGSGTSIGGIDGNNPVITGYLDGISWSSGDESVTYWRPQGLAESHSAAGTQYHLVSWHYQDPNYPGSGQVAEYPNGVRIAVVSTGTLASATYHWVVLADPTSSTDFTASSSTPEESRSSDTTSTSRTPATASAPTTSTRSATSPTCSHQAVEANGDIRAAASGAPTDTTTSCLK